MKKIFIVLNSEKFLLSHRLQIAKQAQKEGLDVYIVAPDTGYVNEILANGLKFIKVDFSRSALNVWNEIRCLFQLYKIYKKEKPDLIHHVTIKICLLGSLAAKMAGIRSVVNAISGFGYAFSDRASRFLRFFVAWLSRFCLKSSYFHFIVQNPDDYEQLKSLNVAKENQITLIKGSGVDLSFFDYMEADEKDFNFLFPSRMLYEKGVLDYINAAKLLRQKLKGKARFLLVGACDKGNRSVISEQDILSLTEPGYIDYLGFCNNMPELLLRCNVAVLPSYYREGLPKALIEACAIGRPIVTTDLPGCKECVRNENGLYVKAKDPEDLAEKLLYLFENRDLRLEMGKRSRELAMRDFDVKNVVKKHIGIYNFLISRK